MEAHKIMTVDELLSETGESNHQGAGVLSSGDRSNYIDNFSKALSSIWNATIENETRGELSDLSEAVAAQDCKKIRSILEKNPALLNEREQKIGFTPLELAVAGCLEESLDIMMDFPLEANLVRSIEGAHFTLLDLATVSAGSVFARNFKEGEKFLIWFVKRLSEQCEIPRSVYVSLESDIFDDLYDAKRNTLGK